MRRRRRRPVKGVWTRPGQVGESGVLQRDHGRGGVNECQDVPGRLPLPGGDPPVLLGLRREPLDPVPVRVPVGVGCPRGGAVPPGRGDHLGAPSRIDRTGDRAVVPLTPDRHPRLVGPNNRRRADHVGGPPGAQNHDRRDPEIGHRGAGLRAEPAPARAGRPGLTFLTPRRHAGGLGRSLSRGATTPGRGPQGVEHGRPRPLSKTAGQTACTPLLLPESGQPVTLRDARLGHDRAASRSNRLSSATGPGGRCSIRLQAASERAWRWLTDCLLASVRVSRLPELPRLAHTTQPFCGSVASIRPNPRKRA